MIQNPFQTIDEKLRKIEHILNEVVSRLDHPDPQRKSLYGDITLAAQLTGLSQSTIYKLVSKKRIPHYKREGRLYFNQQELIEWIKTGRVDSISKKAA